MNPKNHTPENHIKISLFTAKVEADMGSKGFISMKLLVLLHLAILCSSQDFDFYYFVQQVRLFL